MSDAAVGYDHFKQPDGSTYGTTLKTAMKLQEPNASQASALAFLAIGINSFQQGGPVTLEVRSKVIELAYGLLAFCGQEC